MRSLPSVIARSKVVVESVSIIAALALPLAPGGREEAFFAFPSASYARGLVWIIDGAQVTSDFPTPAGDLAQVCKLELLSSILNQLGGLTQA